MSIKECKNKCRWIPCQQAASVITVSNLSNVSIKTVSQNLPDCARVGVLIKQIIRNRRINKPYVCWCSEFFSAKYARNYVAATGSTFLFALNVTGLLQY